MIEYFIHFHCVFGVCIRVCVCVCFCVRILFVYFSLLFSTHFFHFVIINLQIFINPMNNHNNDRIKIENTWKPNNVSFVRWNINRPRQKKKNLKSRRKKNKNKISVIFFHHHHHRSVTNERNDWPSSSPTLNAQWVSFIIFTGIFFFILIFILQFFSSFLLLPLHSHSFHNFHLDESSVSSFNYSLPALNCFQTMKRWRLIDFVH